MVFYANPHSHLDGAILLYQRPRPDGRAAPTWQARLKLARRNGYITRSCKTKCYEEAYVFAKEEYVRSQQKVRDGALSRNGPLASTGRIGLHAK